MKIFNIGITELLVILIIALIVLGPDGIVKTARTLGKTIRKIIRSPIWSMMLDTQRELRDMPTKLVREAGIEEDLAEIRKTQKELQKVTRETQQPAPPQSIPRQPAPTIQKPESPSPVASSEETQDSEHGLAAPAETEVELGELNPAPNGPPDTGLDQDLKENEPPQAN